MGGGGVGEGGGRVTGKGKNNPLPFVSQTKRESALPDCRLLPKAFC